MFNSRVLDTPVQLDHCLANPVRSRRWTSGGGCGSRPRTIRGGVSRQQNRRRGPAAADGGGPEGNRCRYRRRSAQDVDGDRGTGFVRRARPGRSAGRGAPASTQAERRPITVMFCDLVGSTSLAAKLDPEDWRNLVGGYLDAASTAEGAVVACVRSNSSVSPRLSG